MLYCWTDRNVQVCVMNFGYSWLPYVGQLGTYIGPNCENQAAVVPTTEQKPDFHLKYNRIPTRARRYVVKRFAGRNWNYKNHSEHPNGKTQCKTYRANDWIFARAFNGGFIHVTHVPIIIYTPGFPFTTWTTVWYMEPASVVWYVSRDKYKLRNNVKYEPCCETGGKLHAINEPVSATTTVQSVFQNETYSVNLQCLGHPRTCGIWTAPPDTVKSN